MTAKGASVVERNGVASAPVNPGHEYEERLRVAIRQGRRDLNMSQGQFGATLGVSQQSVAAWEKGPALPSLDLFPAIGELIGRPDFGSISMSASSRAWGDIRSIPLREELESLRLIIHKTQAAGVLGDLHANPIDIRIIGEGVREDATYETAHLICDAFGADREMEHSLKIVLLALSYVPGANLKDIEPFLSYEEMRATVIGFMPDGQPREQALRLIETLDMGVVRRMESLLAPLTDDPKVRYRVSGLWNPQATRNAYDRELKHRLELLLSGNREKVARHAERLANWDGEEDCTVPTPEELEEAAKLELEEADGASDEKAHSNDWGADWLEVLDSSEEDGIADDVLAEIDDDAQGTGVPDSASPSDGIPMETVFPDDERYRRITLPDGDIPLGIVGPGTGTKEGVLVYVPSVADRRFRIRPFQGGGAVRLSMTKTVELYNSRAVDWKDGTGEEFKKYCMHEGAYGVQPNDQDGWLEWPVSYSPTVPVRFHNSYHPQGANPAISQHINAVLPPVENGYKRQLEPFVGTGLSGVTVQGTVASIKRHDGYTTMVISDATLTNAPDGRLLATVRDDPMEQLIMFLSTDCPDYEPGSLVSVSGPVYAHTTKRMEGHKNLGIDAQTVRLLRVP